MERGCRVVRRFLHSLLVAALVSAATSFAAPPAPAQQGGPVSVQRVSFPITVDPREKEDLAWGNVYRPARTPACSSSVLLLLHDLSYALHQWDFPLEPERYSMARALASAGYPTVAIDLPGHGSSEAHDDGYKFTLPVYADVVDQVVRQLRAGTYRTSYGTGPTSFAKVGLMGAGVGTEIAEIAAARYGGVDALVATAYTHFPSRDFVSDFVRWDVPQAGDDYTYFGGLPDRRAKYMYNTDAADSEVVKTDTALSQRTPSGLLLSFMSQPSRALVGSIGIPVLVVLAERDFLFPAAHAEDEMSLFFGTGDKSLSIVPRAGHSFLLHRNAPVAQATVEDWLRRRPEAIPAC